MKVGCQHCGASYSVADEKVSGRKVKLRCKKCGESIVLDNTGSDLLPLDLDGENASSAESDASPVWHVSIGDAAQGPYALDEIRSFIANGNMAADALIYRDGWPDWKPLNEVAAVKSASAPRPSRPPAPPPQARNRVSSRPEPRLASMGSDPFDDAPQAPSPRVSSADLLSGIPREGTVQFSVDQIRALSAVSIPNLVSAAPSPKPGFASGNGSGLIDVASMVDLEPVDSWKPISGHDISPLDTMSPMALPVVRGGDGIDFRTKVIAGVVGLGMVLTALVVTVALVTRRPVAVAVVPQSVVAPQPVVAPMQVAAAQPIAQPAPAAAAPEPEAVIETPAPQPEKVAAADTRQRQRTHESVKREPRASSSDDSPRHASKHGVAKHESDPEAIIASGKPSAPKASANKQTSSADIDALIAKDPERTERAPKKGGSASIDELLDGAVSAKKPPPKSESEAKPASDLPSTPSRDDMLAALSKAKAKAAACKGTGVATAAITITGSKGRATSVSVSGVDDAAKSCVEKAVRSTPFPKFQKDTFDVKFPFKLAN
ncbi:MAG: zinc-ribbon domain-containing protein [Polyangiales bacterium]